MASLTDLIERWDSNEGKPYKGSLIDFAAWERGDGHCAMCAQGQVLHLIGGWSPERIRDINGQAKADGEVAKLLNISPGHAVLLRNVNDSVDGAPSIVLTDPGKVLGGEWSKLLDFWWHMDQMAAKDWAAAWDAAWAAAGNPARDAAWDATWAAAWAAAWDAAWAAAGNPAWDAARDAARAAARDAAWDATWAAAWAAAWDAARAAAGTPAWAAANAASEIQGAHLLCEQGKPFFFLPLFGFASPDEIPARPANYGVAA